jgi:UDP-glucuronate 4-epimerase
LLEVCREFSIEHLVFASSSSVYGANAKTPYAVTDAVDHPVSLYAATKKSNELFAHTYSHLYGIPTTGLRFFTVYGPFGRPDMAYFKFTEAILRGRPIEVYNHGAMHRDFTYVDDIVEGVARVLERPPHATTDPGALLSPATSTAPYRIYNIGNHSPVALDTFISTLERVLGVKAQLVYLPMQPGDVLATHADVSDLMRDTGFAPSTPLETGLRHFASWYREHYGANA